MKYANILLIGYLFCYGSGALASERDAQQGILDSLDYYLGEAKSYQYYENRKVFANIDRLIVDGINDHGLSNQIEKRLLNFLKTDASLASKQEICFQLSSHGTKLSIKTLEEMLKSPETFEMALFALERITHSDVDKVFRKYLSNSLNIGVIHALGRRRSESAISELRSLTSHSDKEISKAAVQALGEISSEKALKLLQKGKSEAIGNEKEIYSRAMLIWAHHLVKDGKVKPAISTYQTLMQPSESKHVRNAAFIGLAHLDTKNADQLVYNAISKPDIDIISNAIDLIPQVCSSGNIKSIAEIMPRLAPIHQIQLYAAFIAAGERSVAPNIVSSLDPTHDELCSAAVRAVSRLGDSSHVAVLLKLAIEHPQYEEVVRESLATMKGNAIERAMLVLLEQSGVETQILIVKVFRDRLSPNVEEPLIAKLRDGEDSRLRVEVIKTLGAIAEPSYFLPIFEFLFTAKSGAELSELEKALAMIARKMEGDAQIQPILERYPTVQEVELQCALLHILGRIGNSEALPVIEEALADSTFQVKKAAYSALAVWPNAEPLDRLLRLADTTDDRELKSIALHGYVRMIPGLVEPNAEEKLARYQSGLERAITLNDKQMIFAGMEELPTISSLDIIDDYLDDPLSAPYAEKSIMEIIRNNWWRDREKTRTLLQKMQSNSRDEEVVSFAKTMLLETASR